MDKLTEFGRILKNHLASRGWSQQQLAQAVGIQPSSLSRIIYGARNPSQQLVLAIAAALALPQAEQLRLLASAGHQRARDTAIQASRAVAPIALDHSPGQLVDQLVQAAGLLPDELEQLKPALIALTRELILLVRDAKEGG